MPITDQILALVENRLLMVQWFERDRLEIQPDGRVTAGRLGAEHLELMGTPWQRGPGGPAGAGCMMFVQTGYQVCGPFLAYWRANGGLERFGLPVTGEFEMILEGRPYRVQYFERRRFELHPEIGPNTVLLGLLGREVWENRPTYGDYVTFDDPSGAISVEIPSAWSDISTGVWIRNDVEVPESHGMMASPDIESFHSTWNTPGVFLGASRFLARVSSVDALLDESRHFFDSNCRYEFGGDYRDPVYTGKYNVWTNCGGQNATAVLVAFQPPGKEFIGLLEFQLVSPTDWDALYRCLRSFVVRM